MKKSFTLIELIVVIAIIAILAAVTAPNAFKAIEKAKKIKIIRDFSSLKAAYLNLYGDIGTLPPEGSFCGRAPNQSCWPHPGVAVSMTGIANNDNGYPGWDGPYYDGAAVSPWVAVYRYDHEANSGTYNITTGANPWGGVNVGLAEADFPVSANQAGLFLEMDTIFDDGVNTTGSLRIVGPPGDERMFYLIRAEADTYP